MGEERFSVSWLIVIGGGSRGKSPLQSGVRSFQSGSGEKWKGWIPVEWELWNDGWLKGGFNAFRFGLVLEGGEGHVVEGLCEVSLS